MEKDLTNEQINTCIQYALEKSSSAVQLHELRTINTNSQLLIQKKKLHEINLPSYVNNYFIKKCELLEVPKNTAYKIGRVYIKDSYIKSGNTTDSRNPKLFMETCKISELKANYHSVTAKNCDIGSIDAYRVKLENCYIENITAKKSTKPFLNIDNCNIEYMEFDAEYTSAIIITNCKFQSIPKGVYGLEFPNKYVDLSGTKFPNLNSAEALASYRCLKSACDKADYEHGVILFHGYELEVYYNTSLSKIHWLQLTNPLWPEKVSHIFHKNFTDYGRDIMRPFLWLILLFFLAADFYVGLNKLDIAGFENLNSSNSLFLSFKHSVGPMAFALNSDYWKDLPQPDPDFFGFLHIITSSVIWFLIIFMIRRRFKI